MSTTLSALDVTFIFFNYKDSEENELTGTTYVFDNKASLNVIKHQIEQELKILNGHSPSEISVER